MKEPRPTPPTISEVALAAGVGRATAARTLGGYGYVSAELRARVLAAADELGYLPNRLARSVSTGVSNTIGIVVGDISNPFFGGVVRGAVDTARARSCDALVLSTYESLDDEVAAVGLLLSKRVDGIIVASAAISAERTEHLSAAVEQGIPVVLVDRSIPGVALDAVVIDNRSTVRSAIDLLISEGHRRIGFVWGPPLPVAPAYRRELVEAAAQDLSTDGDRLLGYLDALDDAGIVTDTALVCTGLKTAQHARAEVARMLDLDEPPTAFFCTETDAMTSTLCVLRDREMRIPEDVSVIGLDDSSWAEVMEPPLTMIEQPMQDLGARAAGILFSRIDHDRSPVSTVRLETVLHRRASVTAPGTGSTGSGQRR